MVSRRHLKEIQTGYRYGRNARRDREGIQGAIPSSIRLGRIILLAPFLNDFHILPRTQKGLRKRLEDISRYLKDGEEIENGVQ